MEGLAQNFTQYLNTNPLLAVALVFAAGVATGFTPCTYPLIPITVGIVGADAAKSKLRGFFLSLLYVLGFAVVYAALGLLAGLTGQMFGTVASSPWTSLIIGNFFLYFGLALLEVVPIPFLSYISSMNTPGRFTGRGLWYIPLVGGGSALVAGTCTAPILGALLTFVAVKGNALVGGILLFFFALGMGVLLIAVGTFTGLVTSLPKSGRWLTIMPKVFAALFIITAEYFLVEAGMRWF